MKTLLEHRSIRRYQDKKIPDEMLNLIVEAGIRASTTGNMQVYSIINTTDQRLKEKLAPAHFNQPMVMNAPNVLTFCADFNRFKQWCKLSGAKPGYDNFLSFITAAMDALLVAQNVALAAEEQGLGICYLGTTIYNAQQIIDILKIPKGVVPITTLTIGWPKVVPPKTDRLPVSAILHSETYSDYTEEQIKLLYAEKEALPENRQFVAENNMHTLAQVFTDVRYKKTDNEFFSSKLIEVIKEQGFIF